MSLQDEVCYSIRNGEYQIPQVCLLYLICLSNLEWRNIFRSFQEHVFFEHKNLLILGIKDKTDISRRKKSSVNRLKIIETLKKNNFNNKLHKPNEYFSKLPNYKFVVSPEGNGIDCHRHYEALMAGSIPICEYNEKTEKKYEGLPVLYTKDYSEINEEYLIKKFNEMLKKEYNFDKMFLYYYTKEQQKEIKRCSKHWCGKHNFESHY